MKNKILITEEIAFNCTCTGNTRKDLRAGYWREWWSKLGTGETKESQGTQLESVRPPSGEIHLCFCIFYAWSKWGDMDSWDNYSETVECLSPLLERTRCMCLCMHMHALFFGLCVCVCIGLCIRSWRLYVVDHPSRMKKQMKHSISSKQCRDC